MINLMFMLLYIVIMMFVIEIAVLLFRMTGLEEAVARYQSISMLTGTGFTTEESSLIIDHPIRRRISAGLILFGYFSLAVIISSIASLLTNDLRIETLIIVIVILTGVFAFLRNKITISFLKEKFKHEMDERYDLEDWPLKDALSLKHDETVAMISVEQHPRFAGHRLGDLNLEDIDVQVLLIRRGDIVIRKGIIKEELHEGDEIMIYGHKDSIRHKFPNLVSKDEAQ